MTFELSNVQVQKLASLIKEAASSHSHLINSTKSNIQSHTDIIEDSLAYHDDLLEKI